MSAVVRIKCNDTLPAVEATLTYDDGTPVDLSGATVKFYMARSDGTLKVSAAAEVVDAVNGKVRYNWQAGDTDEEGIFYAEFEVTFANGDKLTAPSADYFIVEIRKDLA